MSADYSPASSIARSTKVSGSADTLFSLPIDLPQGVLPSGVASPSVSPSSRAVANELGDSPAPSSYTRDEKILFAGVVATLLLIGSGVVLFLVQIADALDRLLGGGR